MQNKLDLKPDQTVLFIGDSITDADRNNRAYKPFGFGYVHFVANFLLAKYPAYNLNIINTGISGNTIRDLKSRWQKDVVAKLRSEATKHSAKPCETKCEAPRSLGFRGSPVLQGGVSASEADPHVVFPKRSEGKVMGADHKPDILSILIGVNDVWRRFETEAEIPYAVFPEEYESTYRRLLDEVKAKCNSRLVICEPFMFCDDLSNPMFAQLRRYVELVRKIAVDYNAVLVPLQKAIDERIKEVPPQNWSLDMVHPHLWAHAWIAQQWLIANGL
jgi:lysophospholipase L1-like esterase